MRRRIIWDVIKTLFSGYRKGSFVKGFLRNMFQDFVEKEKKKERKKQRERERKREKGKTMRTIFKEKLEK